MITDVSNVYLVQPVKDIVFGENLKKQNIKNRKNQKWNMDILIKYPNSKIYDVNEVLKIKNLQKAEDEELIFKIFNKKLPDLFKLNVKNKLKLKNIIFSGIK